MIVPDDARPEAAMPSFDVWTYRLERFYSGPEHYARAALPERGHVVRDDRFRHVLVLWTDGWHDGPGIDEHFEWFGVVNITTNRIDPEHRQALLEYSATREQREHLLRVREVHFPVWKE